MNVSFANENKYETAYGIFCQTVATTQRSDALFPTFCRVPVAGATTEHAHFEPEIFFITNGNGIMTIDGESRRVSVGDLVRIPAFSSHRLINEGDEPLEFLSVYSDDFEIPHLPNQVTITAAPPTPNGPLHLGHISGPYLASDIFARRLRAQNVSVHTHCGTDDHQNYVGEKARQLNTNHDLFHKTQRQRIQDGLAALGISFSEFIEPKSDHKYQFKILDFTARAINNGVIQKEMVQLPYCTPCDLILVDSLSPGLCPECGSPSNGGCESCGIVVGPNQLTRVHCGRCGQAATSTASFVYTFNLSQHLPSILPDLQTLNLPPRLQQLIKTVSKKNDLKVIVSHPHNGQRGVRMPQSEHNLHVWFEMAAHYEQFAVSSQTWIHFFGFDNSFYYLLFIPAILRALNPLARLPDAVVTNEFLLLEGSKFSTSRNHAVWADEFAGNREHLRLYLALNRPAQQQIDFTMNDFQSFSQNLSRQLDALIQKANETKYADAPSQIAILHSHRFTKDMDLALSLNQIDFRQASRRLLSFMDQILNSSHGPADDRLKILTLCQQLDVFMPQTAIKLKTALTPTTKPVVNL